MKKFKHTLTIDPEIDDMILRVIVNNLNETMKECVSPNAVFRDVEGDMSSTIIKTYNAFANLKDQFQSIIDKCEAYYAIEDNLNK